MKVLFFLLASLIFVPKVRAVECMPAKISDPPICCFTNDPISQGQLGKLEGTNCVPFSKYEWLDPRNMNVEDSFKAIPNRAVYEEYYYNLGFMCDSLAEKKTKVEKDWCPPLLSHANKVLDVVRDRLPREPIHLSSEELAASRQFYKAAHTPPQLPQLLVPYGTGAQVAPAQGLSPEEQESSDEGSNSKAIETSDESTAAQQVTVEAELRSAVELVINSQEYLPSMLDSTLENNLETVSKISSSGEVSSPDTIETPEEESPILPPETSSAQVAETSVKNCEDTIEKYFSDDANADAVKAFLKNQTELTLNRMAWAQLKLSSKTGSKKTIEENIIALLEKQIADAGEDSEYKYALESFKKAPLSRRALSEIMPSVLELMIAQDADSKENTLFHLSQSDVKMLDLLSTKEDASASSAKFLTNKNDDRSIMHVTKMINSSYRNLDPALYAKNESFLEAEMKRLMAGQEDLLEELMALPGCELVAEMFCAVVPNERVDFMHELENVMSALYKGTLIKETDYAGLRYGEMWLKVKTKK